MVDDKNNGTPDEVPGGDVAEVAAAEALARLLDQGGARRFSGGASAASEAQQGVDPLDLEAIGLLRAASGREAPLGELRARGIARGAIVAARANASRRSARRASRFVWLAAAAALLLVVAGGRRLRPTEAPPQELCSRSAGLLVPGPFPSTQSAADRLDRVTEDRLLALREIRYRSLAGGRR